MGIFSFDLSWLGGRSRRRQKKWKRLLHLIKSDVDRAAMAVAAGNTNGNSIVSMASSYDEIRTILSEDRDLVRWLDTDVWRYKGKHNASGWLLLHYACSGKCSPVVVNLLAQAYPQGICQQAESIASLEAESSKKKNKKEDDKDAKTCSFSTDSDSNSGSNSRQQVAPAAAVRDGGGDDDQKGQAAADTSGDEERRQRPKKPSEKSAGPESKGKSGGQFKRDARLSQSQARRKKRLLRNAKKPPRGPYTIFGNRLNEGVTPLHLACRDVNALETVKVLVNHSKKHVATLGNGGSNGNSSSGSQKRRGSFSSIRSFQDFQTMLSVITGGSERGGDDFDDGDEEEEQEQDSFGFRVLSASDSHGNTPLHVAVSHHDANIDIVKYMLRQSNGTSGGAFGTSRIVGVSNEDGMSALHKACQFKAGLDVILELVRHYDRYCGVKSRETAASAPDAADGSSSAQASASAGGGLMSSSASATTDSTLSSADSASSLVSIATLRDQHGWTPLHWECRTHPRLDVIKCLLGDRSGMMKKQRPAAVAEENDENEDGARQEQGTVPERGAASAAGQSASDDNDYDHFYGHDEDEREQSHDGGESSSAADVDARLTPSPRSSAAIKRGMRELIRAKDKLNGWTPLHILCQHCNDSESLETVKYLVKNDPGCVRSRDTWGRTPLHLACSRSNDSFSLSLIQFLLSKFPNGAMIKDRKGWTPLLLFVVFATHVEDEDEDDDQVDSKNDQGKRKLGHRKKYYFDDLKYMKNECYQDAYTASVIHMLVTSSNPDDVARLPYDMQRLHGLDSSESFDDGESDDGYYYDYDDGEDYLDYDDDEEEFL